MRAMLSVVKFQGFSRLLDVKLVSSTQSFVRVLSGLAPTMSLHLFSLQTACYSGS